MKKNAIMFAKIDREDFWIGGGIVFPVENTGTYEAAYNEIKDKLEKPEMIEHIIEDRCLLDDLFDGDETFKFIKTYWAYALFFVFENEDGDELEYKMTADFIYLTI